jgi:hypothetical protein
MRPRLRSTRPAPPRSCVMADLILEEAPPIRTAFTGLAPSCYCEISANSSVKARIAGPARKTQRFNGFWRFIRFLAGLVQRYTVPHCSAAATDMAGRTCESALIDLGGAQWESDHESRISLRRSRHRFVDDTEFWVSHHGREMTLGSNAPRPRGRGFFSLYGVAASCRRTAPERAP